MSNKNDHDIYIIPPNFIETGTFFGGMFRARNVIEVGILAFGRRFFCAFHLGWPPALLLYA